MTVAIAVMMRSASRCHLLPPPSGATSPDTPLPFQGVLLLWSNNFFCIYQNPIAIVSAISKCSILRWMNTCSRWRRSKSDREMKWNELKWFKMKWRATTSSMWRYSHHLLVGRCVSIYWHIQGRRLFDRLTKLASSYHLLGLKGNNATSSTRWWCMSVFQQRWCGVAGW